LAAKLLEVSEFPLSSVCVRVRRRFGFDAVALLPVSLLPDVESSDGEVVAAWFCATVGVGTGAVTAGGVAGAAGAEAVASGGGVAGAAGGGATGGAGCSWATFARCAARTAYWYVTAPKTASSATPTTILLIGVEFIVGTRL